MSKIKLKQTLKEFLEMEQALYEFCLDALERIYPDHKEYTKNIFNESYENFEYDGCLQPLCVIDARIEAFIKLQQKT